MTSDDIPLSCHRSSPSSPYDFTPPWPVVTSSVRTSFSHTNGVDQFDRSSRSVRHSSSPVAASKAATHDASSLSLTT